MADSVPALEPDVRIRRFLERESVVWVTTACREGRPHIVPVWFLWDGEAILLFSKPDAVKVRCLRDDPRAMLALGDADDDFNVGLIEARAELLDAPIALPHAFVAKYARKMPRGRLDPETFAATYTQAIRFAPTRYLPWRGRTDRPPERRGLRGRLDRPFTTLLRPLRRVTEGGLSAA